MSGKKLSKLAKEYLSEELHIDRRRLKTLKKKLEKLESRSERGAEAFLKISTRSMQQSKTGKSSTTWCSRSYV